MLIIAIFPVSIFFGARCGPALKVKIRMLKNNRAFYEAQPAGMLDDAAKISGMAASPDVKAISPSISRDLRNGGSVLEIGGGSGRVVQFLFSNFPNVKITAIEHSTKNVQSMTERFSTELDQGRFNVHETSIADFTTSEKYDAATWLFCGICEVPNQLRKQAMGKIFESLRKGGSLYIDLHPKSFTEGVGNRIWSRKVNEAVISLQAPYIDELRKMASEAGFIEVAEISYNRDIGRGSVSHDGTPIFGTMNSILHFRR